MNKKYIVDGEDLRNMLHSDIVLQALENGGVDNWENYSDVIHEGRKNLIEWNPEAKAKNEDDLLDYFMSGFKEYVEVE